MNATSSEIKVKAWSPAVPCKIPDNIISSQFTTAKMFIPSYEKVKRPCIEQLLTNEYQRMWWQEKQLWQKIQSSRMPSKRILPRTVIRRKPTAPPVAAVPKKPRKPKQKKEPKKDDAVEKTVEIPAKETEEKPVEETVESPVEETEEHSVERTKTDSIQMVKKHAVAEMKGDEQAKKKRIDNKPVAKKQDRTK